MTTTHDFLYFWFSKIQVGNFPYYPPTSYAPVSHWPCNGHWPPHTIIGKKCHQPWPTVCNEKDRQLCSSRQKGQSRYQAKAIFILYFDSIDLWTVMLKVSKFQKKTTLFSYVPKNERNNSALASRGEDQKRCKQYWVEYVQYSSYSQNDNHEKYAVLGLNGLISKKLNKRYYIKEKKILRAVQDLPAKQHSQPSPIFGANK